MKKLILLIPGLLFSSVVLLGQEIKFETSVVTNSVALHPMIFDVDKDIVTGSLIIWNSPNPDGYHPVTIFVNKGNNLEWRKQIISGKGCYSGTIGDIDDDGDMDFIASRNWNKAPLYLWRNLTNEKLDISSIKISETYEQGIVCLKIETPSATYVYDKAGGGFISLFDKDQQDWISFKTEDFPFPGNAASRYRGIPNLGICVRMMVQDTPGLICVSQK